MNIKVITALATALSLISCATVTKGTKFEVSVTSTPSNATALFIDEEKKYKGESCITPCSVNINRQGRYITTISKAGFDDYKILVRPKLAADGVVGSAGNVATIGAVGGIGIIGAGIDHATGAMRDLYPAKLDIVLQPQGKTSYRMDEDGQRIEELFENRVRN